MATGDHGNASNRKEWGKPPFVFRKFYEMYLLKNAQEEIVLTSANPVTCAEKPADKGDSDGS